MKVSFEALLDRDGILVYKTRGVSMEPMLRQNRDLVIIRAPVCRLRKYDVALYRRGKDYVLHRVVGLRPEGYLMRGDNTYALEQVPEQAVIGVLTGFRRKGKLWDCSSRAYRCYVRLWVGSYPLRALWVRLRPLPRAAARRLGLTRLLKKLLGRDSGPGEGST